jgi:hypothetical protein
MWYRVGLSPLGTVAEAVDEKAVFGPFRHEVLAVFEHRPEGLFVDGPLGHLQGQADDGEGLRGVGGALVVHVDLLCLV